MARLRLLLTTLVLFALTATAAEAADSHAPKGARGDWLPRSEWSCRAGFRSTRRACTRCELAARRGFRDRRALADRLVAPRLRGASAAMKRRLRQRSMDMLTQAHLARHVLVSHLSHARDRAPRAQRSSRSAPRATGACATAAGRRSASPPAAG